jgi:glucose-6-phosphate 1-dehydrogenase
MRERCEEHSRTPVTDAQWSEFEGMLSYVQGPFDDPGTYEAIDAAIGRASSDRGSGQSALSTSRSRRPSSR